MTEDVKSGAELSRRIVTETDALGRALTAEHQDGTRERKVYDCCGLTSSTGRDGQVTLYEKSPGASRTLRGGITGGTKRVGLSTIEEQIGTDGSQITKSRSERGLDGRLRKRVDARGHEIVHSEAVDHATGVRTHTTTYPDGGIRMEERYRDGRLKRVTGSAVHPARYEYGVASPGDGLPAQPFAKYTALNRDGSDSNEWSVTYTDHRGRAWRTVRSCKEDQPAVSSTYFDKIGRVIRSVDADQTTTLYAYFKGNDGTERTIAALDIDGNGEIDYNGSDRISETITEWVELDPSEQEHRKTTNAQSLASRFVKRTTTKLYTTEGNPGASRIVSISDSAVDGKQSWATTGDREYSTSIKENDEGTSITTYASDGTRTIITRGQGRETRRELLNAEGELTQLTVTEYDANGRVVLRTTTNVEGEIIFSNDPDYDTFGRLATSTDHKGRVTSYTYNADSSIGV
jgi:YD repeat-containing protein